MFYFEVFFKKKLVTKPKKRKKMNVHMGPLCVRDLSRVEFVPDNDECKCEIDMQFQDNDQKVLRVRIPRAWKDVLGDLSIVSASSSTSVVTYDTSNDVPDKKQEEEEEDPKQKTRKKKRRLKRRIESEEDDTDESLNKHHTPDAEYSVSTDDSAWPTLDHVRFVEHIEPNVKRDKLLFLDMHGQEITTSLERTEFIVTPDGEVCSINSGHFAMFSCWERGNVVYAPGKPCQMKMVRGEMFLTIEWLKPSRQLASPHASALEEIVLREHFALPVTAFCANLAHLSDSTQVENMGDYYSSLRALNAIVPRPKLGVWAQETGGKRDETSGADLMDLLELRYIKPQWIWRSCLGEYIWKTYVQPAVEFGLKPNLPLVETLLNIPGFDECEIDEKTDCDACGKRDVVKNRVCFGNESYNVGCVCLSRMRYLYRIGTHMRSVRAHVPFNIKQGQNLCVELSTLQKNYQDEQDAFKQRFGSLSQNVYLF